MIADYEASAPSLAFYSPRKDDTWNKREIGVFVEMKAAGLGKLPLKRSSVTIAVTFR